MFQLSIQFRLNLDFKNRKNGTDLTKTFFLKFQIRITYEDILFNF